MTMKPPSSGYPILDWMKANGIPITRAVYIDLNWWGEYTADNLPPECEAQLPLELQEWE